MFITVFHFSKQEVEKEKRREKLVTKPLWQTKHTQLGRGSFFSTTTRKEGSILVLCAQPLTGPNTLRSAHTPDNIENTTELNSLLS